MLIRIAACLLAAIFCVYPGQLTHVHAASAGDWFFVVVETRVHQQGVESDDDHPEERRWYVSTLSTLPDNIPDYSAKKVVGEYFDRNVVDPAKTRGVVVDYYDQELQINSGSVVRVDTKEQAEAMRAKEIEDIKNRGGNIYSFELVFGQAKGEDTSKPKLIYRDKKAANYEGSKSGKPRGL